MEAVGLNDDLENCIWPMDQFSKDFELIDKVGQGSFGKVYRVERKGRMYAAKFVECKGANARLRAREELEILRILRHPNIMQLITAYEDSDDDQIVEVLEMLEGGELFERIVETPEDLTELDIRFVIRQICSGCSFMSSNNIVHLDLKPDNVVCINQSDFRIKIIDFGFARRLEEGKLCRVMQGTPEFVSPEVVNHDPIGLNTDMWSVGVLTYVLLTGLSPFLGDDINETYVNITTEKYSFDEPEFNHISGHAKEFIKLLLVTDHEKRMSAAASLYHPWMIDQCHDAEGLGTKEKMKQIVARLRWQKCKNAIQACTRFSINSNSQ